MKIETIKHEDGFSSVKVTLKGETYKDIFILSSDFETNTEVQKQVAENILQKHDIYNHKFLEQQAEENKGSFSRLEDGRWLYKQEEWQCIFEPIPYTIYTKQVM